MVFRALRRKPSLPPELQELAGTLKQAKKLLNAAEKDHGARVKACRKQLREAEREHERAVRQAQAEIERRRKERAQRIDQAQKRYDSIRATLAPMEVARFGKSVLYEDRVVTKQGEALLQRGVTALADTAAKIAIARPGAVARLAASGTVNGRAFRSVQGYDARRFYLLIEAPELVALLPCRAGDEEAARDFAARVNVAALNARRIEREREETLGDAQHELDAAESHQDAVAAADDELARIVADTEAIDLARARLEEAEADTGAIEAQRERVDGLQGEYDAAYAAEEERLAEQRRVEEERRLEEKRLKDERKAEEKRRTDEEKAQAEAAKKVADADGDGSVDDAEAVETAGAAAESTDAEALEETSAEGSEGEADRAPDETDDGVDDATGEPSTPDASPASETETTAEALETERVEESSRETVVIMETVETSSQPDAASAGEAPNGHVAAEDDGAEPAEGIGVSGKRRADGSPGAA